MAVPAFRALPPIRKIFIGSPFLSAVAGRRPIHAWRLTVVLMIGCAVSIWIAAHLGNPGSVLHDDRPLSRLLRGMALIKGVVTLAAIAAVAWRFGWPVSKSAAAAYLLGSWSMVLASMLIWRLSYIAAAAILFHAAVLCMLFVSWRGDGIRIR